MSKKDNLKFKKRIKAQIMQEVNRLEREPSFTPKAEKPIVSPVVSAKPQENHSPTVVPTSAPSVLPTNSSNLVRADLKKSAIIIGSIIVLIIAIYFVDNKTGFLLKTSSHLFKFLHINA